MTKIKKESFSFDESNYWKHISSILIEKDIIVLFIFLRKYFFNNSIMHIKYKYKYVSLKFEYWHYC